MKQLSRVFAVNVSEPGRVAFERLTAPAPRARGAPRRKKRRLPHAVMAPAHREAGERTDMLRDLTHRVQAEYAEMPGLSVTLPQAQRLWGVDRQTCEAVFRSLLARGVLREPEGGRFIRQ